MTNALTLHYHPLSSFCQKALIALYETETPFERQFVDLGDAASRAAFLAVWPMGKMPVLRDDSRDLTVVESTIIIEYLAQHRPGGTELVPADPDLAREARRLDRFFDCYVQEPVQKVVGDRLRPADVRDPLGVERAKATLRTAYDVLEEELRGRTWAIGEVFTMADCAAAPALYYANLIIPFGDTHPRVAAYSARLLARPSFARAVEEAAPYRALFPAA